MESDPVADACWPRAERCGGALCWCGCDPPRKRLAGRVHGGKGLERPLRVTGRRAPQKAFAQPCGWTRTRFSNIKYLKQRLPFREACVRSKVTVQVSGLYRFRADTFVYRYR